MMLRNFFCLLTLAIGIPVSAQMNYYVATDGNNTNDGSLAAPWLTVQHGLEQLSYGDTLNLREGVYIEKIAIPFSGIALRSMPGEWAVLDAGIMVPQDAVIEIFQVSDILIDSLEIRNNVRNSAQGILVEGDCQNITLQNCWVHDIHFSADPDDNPSPSKNAQAIIVYGSHPTNAITNLNILNNTVSDCRLGYSEGIAVNGNVDGFRVEGNLVYNLTNIGIDVIGHEGTCATDSLDQARNGIIGHNTVHHCISKYATSGGLYTDGGKNLVFEYNTSYANGYGIEIGCENSGTVADSIVVRNNLFYNNESAAVAMGGYNYPSSGKVSNAVFRNNSCLQNDYSEEGYGEIYLSYCENCTIENNIFYTSIQNVWLYAELSQPDLYFDYNAVYTTSGSGALESGWNGDYFTGFDAFLSGSGTNSNSLFADPQFILADTALPQLKLLPGSPAINAGNPATTAAEGETDFDGQLRIQEGLIDMGAYEVTSEKPQYLPAMATKTRMYPNPVSQMLYIEVMEPQFLLIMDVYGRIVYESELHIGTFKLPVHLWPEGYYLLVTGMSCIPFAVQHP